MPITYGTPAPIRTWTSSTTPDKKWDLIPFDSNGAAVAAVNEPLRLDASTDFDLVERNFQKLQQSGKYAIVAIYERIITTPSDPVT